MNAARVMVVDDNLVVRSGLVSLLEAAGFVVVAEAGDGQTAIELAERHRPDLVFLDVQMPLMGGVEAAALLSRIAQVVMLTYTEDPAVIRAAIGNGAVGYLVHGTFTAADLTEAVDHAMNGAHPLSPVAVSALVGLARSGVAVDSASAEPREPAVRGGPVAGAFGLSTREAEITGLIAQGRSNSEIAAELVVAEKTVKNHINRIYAKLGVVSRAAAIARWLGTERGGN